MQKRHRRKFSAEYKAKVAIESLKEKSTIEEIAAKYELHPNQVSTWKKEFLANAAAAFEKSESEGAFKKDRDDELEKAYAEIGRYKIENDFLKKKLL